MQSISQNAFHSDIKAELSRLGFVNISALSMEEYLPYQSCICHSDLAYSLLYAWEPDFSYMFRIVDANPVIVGYDIGGELFFAVIPYHAQDYFKTVSTAAEMLSGLHEDIILKYIPSELAAQAQDLGCTPTYSLDYSDYIYEAVDFVNLSGKKNSTKRHEYNRIAQSFASHRCEELPPERYGEVRQVFDEWCGTHSCEECIWGCERNACFRLLRLMSAHPDNFHVGAVYLDGRVCAFGIAEQLNSDCICYHIQKNAAPVNGLTYYLHYHMAKWHLDVPYINWGEDMGIAGLRFNKQKYHPCKLEHKYEIVFKKIST